jgi:hypothetical protein
MAPIRLYEYNPVGAVKGPYGYREAWPGPIMFSGGPMRIPTRSRFFGDIVVSSDEDVVIANSVASFDQMQEAFQDDQITSGDEGLGQAQARRLKAKLRRNRRRITVRGYAVAANTPYQFGVEANTPYQFGVEAWSPYDYGLGAISFNPKGALKGGLVGGIIGGFKPRIDLKSRKAHEAERASTYDIWYDEAVGGNANSLELLRQAGGVPVAGMPGPPWPRIAPSQGSKDYAAAKYKQAMSLVGAGPRPPSSIAIVPAAPGTPAPAPTSGATDAVGSPIPASIMQASASQPAVGVNQTAAPTASEAVAAAAQDAETGETISQAGFGLPSIDLKDPKVALTLIGLGVFVFTQLGGSKRRRSRRR